MLRRVVATALWAYFGWYLAGHLLSITGMPMDIAPLGGVLVGCVAQYDWHALMRRASGELTPEPLSRSQRTS